MGVAQRTAMGERCGARGPVILGRARVAALLLAVSGAAWAAPARVWVRCPRLLDVASGAIARDRAVLVVGERIAAVGPASAMSVRTGDQVIALPPGSVALPGLVDAHTHLTLTPATILRLSELTSEEELMAGVRNAKAVLEAGFTTVRNVGVYGTARIDVDLRKLIDGGWVSGPRMALSGHPIFERAVSSGASLEGLISAEVDAGADVIKIYASGRIAPPSDPDQPEFSGEQLARAAATAHRLGRKLAAHAEGASGILHAAAAGVDSIEHGWLPDDEAIALMKKNRIFLVPTALGLDFVAAGDRTPEPPAAVSRARKIAERAWPRLRAARAAGVRFALGSDCGMYPAGENRRELELYVERLGMTPLEAIRAATLDAAELLGWQERIGGIQAGRLADLIAVDGDPLQDIRAIRRVVFVMKGGRVERAATPAPSGQRHDPDLP